MKKILTVLIIISAFASGCKKNNSGSVKDNNEGKQQTENINIRISYNPIKKVYKPGENITISVRTDGKADSIRLFFDNKKTAFCDSSRLDAKITLPQMAGAHTVEAKAYAKGKPYTSTRYIRVLSPKKPQQLTYKIIHTYHHDPNAYTQGLLYTDNILYESTGQKGQSSIRKVKLETGQVIQSYMVEADVFGEGITIWGDNLIQLSWQAHRGFVYDKNSFELKKEFYYNTEGWGLTNNDTALIMSDGTNRLFFLNPDTYFVEKTIEVFDNEKPVKYLNELEYIDGKIYANIYTTDIIAVIDPHTGEVLQYINLKGLLKPSDYTSSTDVLNGIAYDKDKKRIFVTGKNWPKLFEVKFIKK